MYNKTYRVNTWVLIDSDDDKKVEKIIKWFKEKQAFVQEWPSLFYKQEVLKYKNMGYPMINENGPFKAPSSLIMRSAVDTVKKVISQQSNIMLGDSANRFSVKIENDDSYESIMNSILLSLLPIYKSQCFQIFERCHSINSKQKYTLFVTPKKGVKKILTDISHNVITLGDKEGCDFNLGDTPLKYISKKLDTDFVDYLSHVGIL